MVLRNFTFIADDPDFRNTRPGSPHPFFHMISPASSSPDVYCPCLGRSAAGSSIIPSQHSQNRMNHDVPGQVDATQNDVNAAWRQHLQETTDNINEADDTDVEALVHHTSSQNSRNSPPGNPSSFYSSSYQWPSEDHPSSSLYDGPQPGIEGLQVSGIGCLGQQIQVCGFTINGTTSCNFKWIRHTEDGPINYIEGATEPFYTITVDDVDTYLAVEVQPLDSRNRKGRPVKAFANGHGKITCDPAIKNYLEKILYNGNASFKVSLLVNNKYVDIWEPAKLAVNRNGFSIKRSGSINVIRKEKFSQNTTVTIPRDGHPKNFTLSGSSGIEHILRAENSSEDDDLTCSRDTIVLALRLFSYSLQRRLMIENKYF